MNARDVVQLLDESVESAKSSGVTSVPIDRLKLLAIEISKMVEEDGDAIVALQEKELEHYKTKLSAWLAQVDFKYQVNLEMFRSVMSAALAALKTVLLINGAAAIAMLAFIGNIWPTSQGKPIINGAACALSWYVWGVLIAGMASAFTYSAQAGYGDVFGKHSQKIGIASHLVAILLVIVSFVIFGYASCIAYTAFTRI